MSGYAAWARQTTLEYGLPAQAPTRVRIVADSASDILPSHARAMGIIMVPNRVIIDSSVLRDGIDITAPQFYARLPRAQSAPYTEPASVDDFYLAYQTAFHQGATAIVSIHVSSRLSQVFQHALAARDYLAPAPIDVIDTQVAGIGMWPAVIRAAKLANLGASIRDVGHIARAMLVRTRVYCLVESLEYLRRGGRIGRAQELVGTLFNAHPILTIQDGEVTPVETVRPRHRALLRMRELALEQGTVETLIVCGTSVETIAEFEALLKEQYSGTIEKTWFGPSLGVHTGPAVAVAVVVRH